MEHRDPGIATQAERERGPAVPAGVVQAARRGDPNAFMAIWEAYESRLRGLAYRTLGDPDLLDDAMQEVAVKAFLGLRRFRGESSVGTWLYQVTYHTCLNLIRGRGRVVPLPDDDALPAADGDDPTDTLLTRIELSAALASLSPDHRAVVFLMIEEGFDQRTTARILGVPPGTVGSRLFSARAALHACLRSPIGLEEEP
jgi:RNA polymerase sigma-70 factor, ECF subfamily